MAAIGQEFGEVTWKDFEVERYAKLANIAMSAGAPIYSGAYLITSGTSAFGQSEKHGNHLRLIEYMMRSHLAEKVQSS